MTAFETVTREDVLQSVQAFVTELLTDRDRDVPEMHADTLLYSIGDEEGPTLELDSLDALDLVSSLEAKYEVEIPDDFDFAEVRTLRDIANAVLSQIS